MQYIFHRLDHRTTGRPAVFSLSRSRLIGERCSTSSSGLFLHHHNHHHRNSDTTSTTISAITSTAETSPPQDHYDDGDLRGGSRGTRDDHDDYAPTTELSVQKRSGVRYATIEKMAKIASAMSTISVVALAVTCFCFALAAGQDSEATEMMFSEDTSMAADELTARPPSSFPDMTSSAGRLSTGGKPGGTNIQKVYRTAKAVDAMSAMMMMVAAATGSSPGTSAEAAAVVAANNLTVANTTSDLEWLSNVYNPHRWNPVQLPAASKLSAQCRDVMKTYLEALRQGSFWAAKSECRICTHRLIYYLYYTRLMTMRKRAQTVWVIDNAC